MMRTLFFVLLIGATFQSKGQTKTFLGECSPSIETSGLDTTATYVLIGYSFAGTVSRNRSDKLREGLRLEHGMEVRPTLQWFRQLGFCGDDRFILRRVEFIVRDSESELQYCLVKFLMSRRKRVREKL